MSRVIKHQLLEQIGDPRKMTQRNLDQVIKRSEQTLALADKGLTSRVLSLFIPREGISRPLTFSEVIDEFGSSTTVKPESVQTVLDTLEEEQVLRTDEDRTYQLASNVLASQFFNKIEADRMVTRQVENFIQDRYTIFKEKNILLTQPDLNYINPYIATISISEEETAFIRNSKAELERKKRRRALIISLVITALSILSLLASWQYLRANKALKAAEEARIQAEVAKEEAEKLSDENAELAKVNAAEAKRNGELAQRNETLANEAQQEARTNALLAAKNKTLAEANKAEAEKNADLALKNAQYAAQEARRAEENALLASKNADLAKRETERAEAEKKLADKNKAMQQIAFSHSLAKQVNQMDDEQAELKALLAQKAYQINVNTEEGDVYQQDIYNALYQAVKSINNAKGRTVFNRIENERGRIRSIVFAKDKEGNTFYTISSSGYLKKWTISQWHDMGKPDYKVTPMVKLGKTLNKMVISNDQKWLAVAGEINDVLLFNLEDVKLAPIHLNLHDNKEVYTIAFLPNNKALLTVGADKTIKHYDLASKATTTIASEDAFITAMTISADPPYALFYGTEKGELFENDLDGNHLKHVINSHVETPKKITAIGASFYNGRRQLFVGHSNGLIKIMEAKTGGWFPVNRANVVLHNVSRFHTAQIADIQFSPGGHYMGITSYDGRATFWNIDKAINDLYYQPMVFSGDSWATAVGFSERTPHVIIGYREGDLLFFNPDPKTYADAICDQLNRDLTQDEWDLFIGEALDTRLYRKTCK